MDSEKRAKRQSIRIIVSELFMVIAVIITVAILALVVSGYWLNSDFKVERQGLLQISSIPTGADVEIDGNSSWLQRTNTSKVLSSGLHKIVLTKDGYDSWSREIKISEGLLYRVHYPRLFLNDREKETIYSAPATTFATVSPNHNFLLLVNKTTEWELINLDSEKQNIKKIDVGSVFSNVSMANGATAGLFTGEIISADWDANNEHILFQIKDNEKTTWTLLNINNIENSVDLTKEFNADFTRVKIFDNSASKLLAVTGGNLHRIDVNGRQISSVLVEDIQDFDFYDDEIFFSAAKSSNSYYVGISKINDNKITELLETKIPAEVAISKFYDDKYLVVLLDNVVTLYKKDDFVEVLSRALEFLPKNIKVGGDGEFFNMSIDKQIASLDMEAMNIREWEVSSSNFGWLDGSMIYSVKDGELTVYDFDGLNARNLSKNVSERLPVTITSNKWLYYFSDDNLIRELITR